MIFEPHLLIAFIAASLLVAIIPGPIVMLVIANSLAHGTGHGLRTLLGTASGTAVLFLVGGFGMTWVLAILSDWFDVIRLVGAAYLVWLGIKTWQAPPVRLPENEHRVKGGVSFLQGFLIAVTNPKTIVFFAAFFPQFVAPDLPAGPQFAILSVTFLVIATLTDAGYALLCGKLRPWLTGERRGRIRNRISGSLLIGTGVFMALVRKQ